MTDFTISRFAAMCLFGIAVACLGIYMDAKHLTLALTQWMLIGFGTFGLSRIIAREKVCEPVRSWCNKTPLKEVVNCPRCIGAWIALILTASLIASPYYIPMVCALFGIIGTNIVLHELTGILIAYSERLEIQNTNMKNYDPKRVTYT